MIVVRPIMRSEVQMNHKKFGFSFLGWIKPHRHLLDPQLGVDRCADALGFLLVMAMGYCLAIDGLVFWRRSNSRKVKPSDSHPLREGMRRIHAWSII
jgi:hypothetical protein